MKKNDIVQLAVKSREELQAQLSTLSRELAEKRQSKRVGKLANLALLSRLADDIARIKTVLHNQDLVAAVQGDKE